MTPQRRRTNLARGWTPAKKTVNYSPNIRNSGFARIRVSGPAFRASFAQLENASRNHTYSILEKRSHKRPDHHKYTLRASAKKSLVLKKTFFGLSHGSMIACDALSTAKPRRSATPCRALAMRGVSFRPCRDALLADPLAAPIF